MKAGGPNQEFICDEIVVSCSSVIHDRPSIGNLPSGRFQRISMGVPVKTWARRDAIRREMALFACWRVIIFMVLPGELDGGFFGLRHWLMTVGEQFID